MSSKCSDLGNVQERREGPARQSPASSLGEGREPGDRRGGGRGILRESVEGGMAGCLLSTGGCGKPVQNMGPASSKQGWWPICFEGPQRTKTTMASVAFERPELI